MESLIQSQIFFFIASVATIVLAVLAGIALWHMSRVAKNIHLASNVVKQEMETIVSHVSGAREHIEDILASVKDAIIKKTPKKQTSKKTTTNK